MAEERSSDEQRAGGRAPASGPRPNSSASSSVLPEPRILIFFDYA